MRGARGNGSRKGSRPLMFPLLPNRECCTYVGAPFSIASPIDDPDTRTRVELPIELPCTRHDEFSMEPSMNPDGMEGPPDLKVSC